MKLMQDEGSAIERAAHVRLIGLVARLRNVRTFEHQMLYRWVFVCYIVQQVVYCWGILRMLGQFLCRRQQYQESEKFCRLKYEALRLFLFGVRGYYSEEF